MIGETILHYEITEKIGAGGMGEVYLAVDSKLDRKVALKFLPEHMAPLGEVKARFMQEAKAASAMNHPNVCTIHDISDHNGRMFIVMEYIDGTTLREKRGSMSISQVCEIGAQIADGLGAAHAKGIVHRDIKGENIMIRKDGIVQIMDFGLAKLRGVTRLTKEGSTIGTVGYMSPEQAQGQDVDHRTDIFSLGVVLFEMLTGELPFRGEHEAAIMYEIVNVDSPPPSALVPEIEPELDRIVLECLQKEPDERYQSAKEVAKDLRRYKRDTGRKRVSRVSTIRPSQAQIAPPQDTVSHVTVAAAPVSKKRSNWLPWGIVGILAIALVVLLTMSLQQPSIKSSVVRLSIPPPEFHNLPQLGGGSVSVSPDGQHIVFVASDSLGKQSLWLRSIDDFESRELPNSEDADYPFWSPDSRYICFFGDSHLKKLDITGGPAVTLCEAGAGRGGTWNQNGDIIFAPDQVGWLHRVSAAGGPSEQITFPDSTRNEATHRWPWFLPDGNRFLFYSRSAGEGSSDAVIMGYLDGRAPKLIMNHPGNAAFANGHILFVRENLLMAQPFDSEQDTLRGAPFPIAEEANFNALFNSSEFCPSANGTIAYLIGELNANNQVLKVSRTGEILDTILADRQLSAIKLSPDGNQLAVTITDPEANNADIWIYELNRGVLTRLTFDTTTQFLPVWSPDGHRVAYTSFDQGGYELRVKETSGASEYTSLYKSEHLLRAMDWSHDGRYILCRHRARVAGQDFTFVIPVDPTGTKLDGESFRIGDTPADVDVGQFSPNGQWFCYASTESGNTQIYVRKFPGPSGKWQVTRDGGDRPLWSDDGKSIYYLSTEGNRVHATTVNTDDGTLRFMGDSQLFGMSIGGNASPYDVSSDGQEFFISTGPFIHGAGHINVIVNWPEEFLEQ